MTEPSYQEQAVEAAEARLIGENPPGTKAWWDTTRNEIRATLEAAEPYIRAEALVNVAEAFETHRHDEAMRCPEIALYCREQAALQLDEERTR